MRGWLSQGRYLWLGALALLATIFLGATLEARPGGGDSFGTPGGGGGGGGDGELIYFLVRIWFEIVFRYPQFGVPATIVLVFLIWRIKRGQLAPREDVWDSAPAAVPPPPPARRYNLDGLLELDEAFSPVLFEDFAYALFAKAHESRSQPKALESLAPYLSPEARQHLTFREPRGAEVSRVLVGGMRLSFVDYPNPGQTDGFVRVHLEFEANLTLTVGGGRQSHSAGQSEQTRYVRERWLLKRRAKAKSRPPEAQKEFGCPNCGAPYAPGDGERCGYCHEQVVDGRFDWSVERIVLLTSLDGPPTLRGVVPEKGTHLPTLYQQGLESRVRDLFGEVPGESGAAGIEAFGHRFGLVFHDLNDAWSGLDLARARPFLSDGLFDYLQYWIEAYRAQGLRNVLENFRITRWEFAKVTRDQYFDAVTLRFWATGRDSTIDQAGRVVGGDPHRQRPYSEYWTFIRGRGVSGLASSERRCPNCGAAHEINMAGACAHCGAKITRGEFDWVLSKIQQDEVYGG